MNIWEKVLFKGHSEINGEIKVIESRGIRRLIAEKYTQSRTLKEEDGNTDYYWGTFAENLPPLSKNSRVLILGLAAGTIAKIILNKEGSTTIDGVEIDPVMIDLGKKYFYLNDPNIRIFIEDAEKFVERTRDKYDVICLDMFTRDKASDLITDETFLKKTKKMLKKGGVVVVNKICRDTGEDKEYVEILRRVFGDIKVVRDRGTHYEQNVIIYGSI